MTKLLGFALGLVLVTACAAPSFAQDKPKSKMRTVTGCLEKGDSADEFVLKGKDGSTWEIRNSNSQVSLSDHVGHMVAVSGVVEHAKETAKDTGVKKDDSEKGHLKVTSVKHVSASCK